MNITLANLVLEITRRCNMKCAHCLRGAAQPVDMDLEIINRVTRESDCICGLTLTGGEPSLNADAIRHIRYCTYCNGCDLGSFWLATNARYFKPEFYQEIEELYGACYEQRECVLTISGDQYHLRHSEVAYERYSELPFFNDSHMRNIPDWWLINEGYARKNWLGGKDLQPKRLLEDTYYSAENDRLYVGDMIYINAMGDVLLGCDYSYASQKARSIGNVLRTRLEDIVFALMDEKMAIAA